MAKLRELGDKINSLTENKLARYYILAVMMKEKFDRDDYNIFIEIYNYYNQTLYPDDRTINPVILEGYVRSHSEELANISKEIDTILEEIHQEKVKYLMDEI